jgi:glycogen debranching enzyme
MNTYTQSIILKAYQTALRTLKDRYADEGILAGKKHFSDLWLRDSCYAAMGALSVGDTGVVKASLETMLKHQSKTGQIPLRVGQKWFMLKYLGFDAKTPQARFKEDKEISIPTDSNSLFTITVAEYATISQDKAFVVQYWDRIKKAVLWNLSQDHNHDLLIEEGPYSGWADSLKKTGAVLYTNVLFLHALRRFAELCRWIENRAEADHFEYLFLCAQKKFNELFWNGDYFIDWISPQGNRVSHFSTDGNVLAIIYGIATEEQSQSIQNYITKYRLDQEFSTQTVHPPYPKAHVYTPFHLIRLSDYHNGLQWLWVGCADAVSKWMIGKKEEAISLLGRIAEKIVEHDGVFEVYEGGKPVRRLFYKSEHWFSWSAGLFVWACHRLKFV